MNDGIAVLVFLAAVGYGAYFLYNRVTDPVIHWDAHTDLEVIPGSYHDGTLRAWSKEGIIKGQDGKATPTTVVTIELNCRTAQFRNVALKMNGSNSYDLPDSAWSSVQPDTAEAKLLAAGCKSR